MRLHTAAGWRSLLFSTLLCTGAWAKKDKPTVHSKKFDFIPYNVNYFDDSDVLLFEDTTSHNVWRSTDAGESWDKVDGVPEGKMLGLSMHAFEKKRAYIIMDQTTHYKTADQGKTWDKFEVEAQSSMFRAALTYHAGDPDRIIFNAMDCASIFCEELTMYTTDGFAKDAKFLRADTSGCHWAKASELFTTGQKDLDNDRILCVVKGRFSPWRTDYRLLVSDNFFAEKDGTIQEFEPELEAGRTVQGIVNMAVVKPYVVVAATAENTDEMALYVSDDTVKWHRAIFPQDHKVEEDAYTLLEGTNYSIQVDVQSGRPSNPMGVFFSSNSNGTFFTRNMEHMNRNSYGSVDFEKVYGIQGIVLVNVVDNWENVEKSNAEKKVVSKISFDDGRSWESITVDKDNLHLHSITDMSNSGRVFTSPAPGLVMGVGNVGKHLTEYDDGSLYVSDDAGLTWRKGLDGPHKYEFGDQGSILVAMKEGLGKEVRYSINHGKDWGKIELPHKVRPVQLTTVQDSTSLKFLLEAVDEKKAHGYIFALDFEGMHEAQCKDDDLEVWHARVDSDGKATCLMGHKQSYRRRKADADCFLKSEFNDPEVISEPCECTDADFECDFNFVRSEDRKECVKAGDLILPDGACKGFGPDDTFKGSSGWRLIPGNDCKRAEGKQKDDPVDRKCVDAVGQPASGKPSGDTHHPHIGKTFKNKVYLERTGVTQSVDETVLMRTESGVFISQDHGKKWEQIFKDEPILEIVKHPYFFDMVFFLTDTKKVYYSTDRGRNIRSFEVPDKPNPNKYITMSFHPKKKDWIIWTGERDCPGSECHAVASVTTDRGDSQWKTLQRYVQKCEFIKEPDNEYRPPGPRPEIDMNSRNKLIYCEVSEKESNDQNNNPMKLVSSLNFFDDEPNTHFTNVVAFATMSEFIVVATKDDKAGSLKMEASVNGDTFADAQFPYGFNVEHQSGYTVLESSTHSIFAHVTVNNNQDLEYGSLIKSNSNGTSYTMSVDGVNRDAAGYVDFEKMLGIQGVALVNVVANVGDKNFKSDGKKLKTMITHNDGAEWDYIKPPTTDADGKKFSCTSNSLEKCSLNIHGYTERADVSHTYSSASAIGLMLGTGNVGQYLVGKKDADTFITSDGGITWTSAMKGSYLWEFGDQGSIIVIVKEGVSTNVVHYTLDEGKTWNEYKFAEKEFEISDLSTVPSGTARSFLLWGNDGKDLLTISLDFTGLTDVECELDEENTEGGDYYLWTPKHPKQSDDCLFGHVSQYHRKRTSSQCFNGRPIPHLHDVLRNCDCTRQDFECDFNYQRQNDGSCALVPGFTPYDHSLICKEDENRIEYDDPTGYRRIPLSTCEGGKEMDKSISHACPGKGDQFDKKHGISALGLFFAIIIPIAAAAGVGYWVWKNFASKFGQIRLGEGASFDGEAPYIKYPVLVVAGLVAAIQAAPLLAASLWRSASTAFGRGRTARFTTRDSFARGRGDYAVVDEDEGELLGEDSDEEV